MKPYRRAAELPKSEPRMPTSVRLRKALRAQLEQEAKKGGITVAELIEAVLEDYSRWLTNQKD